MTRDEHMAWCKKRALAYLPHDPMQAITSMLSDIRKHPETKSDILAGLTINLMMIGALSTSEQARHHIEGFH